jgi:hypothetical protein
MWVKESASFNVRTSRELRAHCEKARVTNSGKGNTDEPAWGRPIRAAPSINEETGSNPASRDSIKSLLPTADQRKANLIEQDGLSGGTARVGDSTEGSHYAVTRE